MTFKTRSSSAEMIVVSEPKLTFEEELSPLSQFASSKRRENAHKDV